MLRKVNDITIMLIRKEFNNLGIVNEVKETDIDKIFEYFEMKEIEYSTKQYNGQEVDSDEFRNICIAVDDFSIDADSEDYIDLVDLNKRLGLKF